MTLQDNTENRRCVWCSKVKKDMEEGWMWGIHYKNGKVFDKDAYCPDCSIQLKLKCEKHK